jgi:membrane-associated protease RseP (regulator of RpoE activity)
MKRKWPVLLLLLLFGSVYPDDASQKTPVQPGFVRRPMMGINNVNMNGQIQVIKVNEGFGAGEAGIRKGDIIKTINGRPVLERADVIRLVENMNEEDKAVVGIFRDGEEIEFEVRLQTGDIRQDLDAVIRLLLQEKTVNLVIAVGAVSNATITDKLMLEQWANGLRSILLARQEQVYLATFKAEVNFHLADRAKTDQLLSEFNFSQTGHVTDQMRVQMGKMLGATHILDVSCSRFANQDCVQFRLVGIESGEVISSSSIPAPIQTWIP